MSLSSIERLTFYDAVEHVLDVFDTDFQREVARNAMRAVTSAYREIPATHPWSYYMRSGTIITQEPYSTGTVVYDYTGGTYERQLTLTGGTWPSWTQYGQVLIDGKRYAVDRVYSSTVIQLSENNCPTADIASSTYTLSRSLYPLPVTAVRVSDLVELNNGQSISVVSDNDRHEYLIGNASPQRGIVASIRSDASVQGELQLDIAPPPNSSRTYAYTYEARPKRLRVYEYSTGTVSCTSGDATITGSGTTWDSTMVGTMIRISSSSSIQPTSVIGTRSNAHDVRNPAVVEGIVKAVDSATSIELEKAVDTTLSAVRYTLSDVIDIEPGAMTNYFLSLCELYFATYEGTEDLGRFYAQERRMKTAAMVADNREVSLGSASATSNWTLDDWAT